MNPVMNASNEIVTLQFGHYSNFIGAHWWNVQEFGFSYNPDAPSEINNDILFREGLTAKGEATFTPRLLLADLKGSLKSLREDGELYKTPHDDDESTSYDTVKQETHEKIQFQKDLLQSANLTTAKIYDLDNEVRVWSDILYTRLHPRSVNIINEYQHENENTPFNLYPLGNDLWKTEYFCDDFSDKVRNYIEECDNFQGFHVIQDSIDGFSGLSSSCIQHLRDEYETKAILGFPVIPFVPIGEKHDEKLINLTLSFDALAEHASLFIPLSIQDKNAEPRKFKHLSYKPDLVYHSSAILASFLDTFSLNYRLKSCRHSLIDFCRDFNNHNRKAAAASLNLPFPLAPGEDLIDCLDKFEGPLFTSITPSCEISQDKNLQALVLRGISESRLKRQSAKQREMPAYKCDTIKDMLSFYVDCTSFSSKTDVTVAREALPIKTPFPRVFEGINRASESVNALAGVHSGEFVGEMFDCLIGEVEKIKFKNCTQFQTAGLECDEFNECFHRVLDLRDCYKDDSFI